MNKLMIILSLGILSVSSLRAQTNKNTDLPDDAVKSKSQE